MDVDSESDSDSDIELLTAPVAARPFEGENNLAAPSYSQKRPQQLNGVTTSTFDGLSRKATSRQADLGDAPASTHISNGLLANHRPAVALPVSEIIEIDDESDNDGSTITDCTHTASGSFRQVSASRHMYAYNSVSHLARSSSAPVPRFADDMNLSDDGDDLPEIGAPSIRFLGRSQSENLALYTAPAGLSRTSKGKGRELLPEQPSSPRVRSQARIAHESLAEISEPEHFLHLDTRFQNTDEVEPEKRLKKRKLPITTGQVNYPTNDASMTVTERKKLEAQHRKAVKDAEKAEKAAKLAAEKEAKSIMRGSNKLLSRAQTPKELIVDISTALMADAIFKSKVYTDLDARLSLLDCVHTQPGEEIPVRSSSFDRIITWRRKINKDYDQEKRYWRPREAGKSTVEQEKTVLLFMNVSDMEDAILARKSGEIGKTLVEVASAARAAYGNDYQIFLLVQGLLEKTKAKARAANADWGATLRGEDDSDAATAAKPRPKRKTGAFNNQVSVDEIEMELIRVQVALHRCFVIRAETPASAVDWLVELTKDISFRPYKLVERAREIFLNIDGKIATKGGLRETYRNQLECIHGVTASMAAAIAQKYPTWKCLLTAYKQCDNIQDKHNLLQGLRVSNRIDGAATSRMIGKAMSEKIYIVLFTQNKNLDISGDMKSVRARLADG